MIQVVRNAEFVPTGRVGPIQRIRRKRDLKTIRFLDGVAALEIHFSVVKRLKIKGDMRPRSHHVEQLVHSMREKGYVPFDPIVCRITRKGKLHVIDGGHRLTAARIVDREFWPNLFSRKIRTVYFLVFQSPERWPKVKRIAADGSSAGDGGKT